MTVRVTVRELTVQFGGLTAVDRLDLTLSGGTVLGLIGPNGAGKSTVINALTGFVPAQAAEMSLHDGDATTDLRTVPIRARSRLGVVRTFQTPRLIPELTVAQNVAMGGVSDGIRKRWFEAFGGPALRNGTRQRHEAAVAALGELGLARLADQDPAELSLGEQRLVEMARAVLSGAKVMLLDEPFAGLSVPEQGRLTGEVGKLRSAGIAILLVEHHLDRVRDLADTVVAMDQGAEFASGAAADVLDSTEVRERYLGEVAI